jgi:transposase-like protein
LERSELVERYEAGESANDLARRFGVHRTTVTQQLKRAGVQTRCRSLSKRDVAKAVKLYRDGKSLAQVGDHLGVHANTIRKALLEAGVETRSVGTNQWKA